MTETILFQPTESTAYEFRCTGNDEILLRVENCRTPTEAAVKLRRWLNHLTHTDGLHCEVVSLGAIKS